MVSLMIKRISKNGIAFFILLSVTACFSPVSKNIGVTDYAVSQGQGSVLLPKYRDVRSDAVINKGDSILVTLQQGFIENFSERWEKITSKLHLNTVRGEIAVLAKIYQSEDNEKISFGADFKKGARLVYYSDDVRPGGQHLNFSSIPIYGPIKYNGGPIVIELAILELDLQESAQLKGLLNQLVQFGKIAYPPAAPELQILDSLGGQLLSGEQDDWEFSYKFVLYPPTGSGIVNSATLEVGNYVLYNRKGSGLSSFQLLNYKFDSENGIVVKEKGTGNSTLAPVLDESYLVLQIEKGHSSKELDVLQSFDSFRSSILKEVSKEGGSVQEITDKLVVEINKEVNEQTISERIQLSGVLIKEYEKILKEDESRSLVNTLQKKVLATQLYNTLIERIGFPKDANSTVIQLTDEQRYNVLRDIYRIVKEPASFPISFDKVDFDTADKFIEYLK